MMPRRGSAGWFGSPLLGVALAACVGYRAAPIDPDAGATAFAARRLDDDGTRAFVAAFAGEAEPGWAKAPSRTQLLAVALCHRAELKEARRALAAATAAAGVAGQLPNPHLAVGPGVVANPGDATRWLLGLGLSFPLTFGQRSAEQDAAASDVAAARLALARAELAVRVEVIERLLDCQRDVALGDAARAFELARQRRAGRAEQRAELGAGDAIEVAAARADALAATQARLAAEHAVAAGRAALAGSLGLPATALADCALPGLPVTVPPLAAGEQQAAAAAVAHRLDVAVALCSYGKREAELRLEVARQWPDFEFGPGYEYDQGLRKFRLDFGLTLPLFHGNGAAIDAAVAARAVAGAAVETVQQHAIAEIDAAQLEFANGRQQLAGADAGLALAVTAADAATARAAIGDADQFVVLDAEARAAEAAAELARRQHAAALGWLRLELAIEHAVGPGLVDFEHSLPEALP